jgi:uncharacterized surface protein with fasciclin (FAS1) repeats
MKKLLSLKFAVLTSVIMMVSTGCGSSNVLSEGSSLMSALSGNPNLSTITSLLKTPGLSNLLGGALKGKSTLLAPTNDAFNALSPTALTDLKNPSNVSQIANLLKNSIVPGKLDAASIAKGGVSTAAGNPLDLKGANLGSVIDAGNINVIPIDKVLQ